MKFVCDNCKAKYQIGDDKVSGKTVRMKCRRCGHLILVSAAVTESSVSRPLPAEGTQLGTAGNRPSHPPPEAPAGSVPVASSAADLVEDEEGHTAIMNVPPQLARRPAPPARPSTGGLRMPMGGMSTGGPPVGPGPASSPGAPAAPRSSAVPAVPIARPSGVPSRPSTSGVPVVGGSPRPPPARPATIPRAGGATPPPPGVSGGLVPQASPSAPSLADLSQRSMASAISAAARSSTPVPSGARSVPPASARMTATPAAGTPAAGLSSAAGLSGAGGAAGGAGLHGGGAQHGGVGPGAGQASSGLGPDRGPGGAPGAGGVAGAFQRAVAGTQPVLRTDTPGEDWYVGVGGVPLGPVRLSVIREKVDQGAVDGESLVWREGFDEWQPLRNVAGLRAILDERRVSAAPDVQRVSAASLPRVSAPTPVPGALHASASLPAVTAPPAVNGHGALSVGNVPTGGVSLGPAATPIPGITAEPASPSSDLLGSVAAGATSGAAAAALPSAAPPTPSSAGAATPSATPSVPPPARERRGMHPFAYAMIAMAAVFGGVAAWVLLKPAPQQVIVVQATAPTTPGLAVAPPPPPTADEPSTAPSADPGGSAGSKVASGGPAGPRPSAAATPTGTPGQPPPNLGSFDQGLGGPTAGPGKDGAGSGRGQLSEGEISSVVQRNMPGVRRRCWQPALDARAASAPKSARVSTSISISPSGSVSAVSASGSEQHFPGLSSCIGGAIRGWQFPPSDGPSTVNVPFSFNAQ